MIHEYALEPALLSTWPNFRYLTEKFGIPKGRLISRYPNRWKRLVYASLGACRDIERKRIEQGLQGLDGKMLHRKSEWDPGQVWLSNAIAEHAKRPFHAVVAEAIPDGMEFVVGGDALDERHPLLAVPTGVRVIRTAEQMARVAGPLLRCSRRIILVDPYFGPEKGRHRRPLEHLLLAVAHGRALDGSTCVEYHISNRATYKFVCEESQRRLPPIVPVGLSLKIVRWQQQSLHNRYILTERGGLLFGTGLDEGEDPAEDDVSLLDETQHAQLWADYTGETNNLTSAGDPDPILVQGTRGRTTPA